MMDNTLATDLIRYMEGVATEVGAAAGALQRLSADLAEQAQELRDALERTAPKPPIDVMDLLPWNGASPWPFPTQGKAAPLERVRYITLHHSAGKRALTSVSYWNDFHTRSKRWPHVGYHFGVGAFESGDQVDLYQMNRTGEFTWHDGRNHDTVGVCIAGDLRAGRDGAPSERQVELLARLFVWLIPQLPNLTGITVHKKIGSTLCPGDVERWGRGVVEATRKTGLDITAMFNIAPQGARLARARGVLRRQPPMAAYEDV
jgi:hypothetical protein